MKNSLYVYIEDHITLLFESLVIGILLAVLYDVFRMIRTFLGCGIPIKNEYREYDLPLIGPIRKSKTKKRWQSTVLLTLFDTVYSLLFTVSLLLFFYYTSDGVFRWFALAAIIFGFVFYMKTVGRLTKKTAEIILFSVLTILRYICYFTIKPILYTVSKIKKLTIKIYNKTVSVWLKKILYRRANKRISGYLDGVLKEELSEFTKKVFGTE